jgi:FixJ family two-component response regulator
MKVHMFHSSVVSIVDDDPSVCEGQVDLLNSMGFMAETFPAPMNSSNPAVLRARLV